MRRSIISTTSLLLGALLLFSSCLVLAADPTKKLTMSELTKKVKPPRPTTYQDDPKRGGHFVPRRACGSSKAMQSMVGVLYYLSRKGHEPYRPYYLLKAGSFLAELDEDAAAYQLLDEVIKLPKGTAYDSKNIYDGPRNLQALINNAKLTRARILARNGLLDEMDKELHGFKANTGYEKLLLGEVYALAGRKDDALPLLKDAVQKPHGHPIGNWSRTFVPMRVIPLIKVLGDEELAKQVGGNLVGKGKNAQKWPQWKGAWEIMNKALSLPPTPELKDLKDGKYTGSCQGYKGDIEVGVVIKGGQIKMVKVLKHKENRAYSAIEEIPKRIVKQQSLAVDAVSGATMSSEAIIMAADEALSKAKK